MNWRDLNQPELTEQLRRGDKTAFKQLVDGCQDMVYNTVLSIVQDEAAADDVTQEVFIRAFQSMSSFRGDARLSTWLYRIAVSAALDYERAAKRKKRFAFVHRLLGNAAEEAAGVSDFQHPGIALEKKEAAKALFRVLEQLPDKQRVAFTLHKLEGLSYQEVAAVMRTTVPAVESLMGRAKKGLRQQLTAFYEQNR